MEPEVHIIEKYFQEIFHCFTMTNIRCKRGKEIDLLAMNPRTGEKYHVEARIGTSPSLKIRLHDTHTKDGRSHRIGIDYFAKEKFNHPIIAEKIKELLGDSDYKKILVVWDVKDHTVFRKAKELYGIHIVFIEDYIHDLLLKGSITGSRDHVFRTIELMSKSIRAYTFGRRYRLRLVDRKNEKALG